MIIFKIVLSPLFWTKRQGIKNNKQGGEKTWQYLY